MSIEIDNMKNTLAAEKAKDEGGRMKDEKSSSFILHPSSFPRRRGSVLIMVVALLVLIALIATAMLSTTRNDRFASVQHQQNVQIDLLVEGAKQIALSHLLNDTYGIANSQNMYRPGDAVQRDNSYSSFDGFSTVYADVGTVAPKTDDKWLMPRTPSLQYYGVSGPGILTADNTNLPVWPKITAPLVGNTFESPASTPKAYRNDDPDNNGNLWKPYTGIRRVTTGTGSTDYRADIIPTVFRTTGGEEYPALGIWDRLRGQFFSYIAADTDGDGIADAMLQKLPTGPINGVTYFVGYRIIDNNSAINPNVATSSYVDFVNNGSGLGIKAPNLALFPSNIGLVEMLKFNNANANGSYGNTGTLTSVLGDFYRLLNYRTGDTNITANMVPDGVANTTTSGKDLPRDDNGTPDTLFKYLLYSNAVWDALGVRQSDPGWANQFARFKAFDVGDAMSLAYPFGIRSASATKSALETVFDGSMYDSQDPTGMPGATTNGRPTVATVPFSARTTLGLSRWYMSLFNWYKNNIPINANIANNGEFVPARSIVAPYNPTSAYGNIGSFDIPSTTTPALNTAYTFIQYNAALAGTAGTLDLKSAAPRASINTGTFSELYRAFFSVMAENWKVDQTQNLNRLQGTPFSGMLDATAGQITTPTAYDPFYGMKWTRPPVAALMNYSFAIEPAAQLEINNMKMFRSSVRNPPPAGGFTNVNTPRIPPADMVKLRAAIAAANTIAARKDDYNIEPVDIPVGLTDNLGTPVASGQARIYGLGPQVFITEVYVQTDDTAGTGAANPNGYIAIELHNPNPFPIDLENCRLMALDRVTTAGTYPNLGNSGAAPTIVPITLDASSASPTVFSNMGSPTPPKATVIPANGYLVLENLDARATADPTAATHRPTAMVNATMPIPPTGTITPTTSTVTNFAYVAGLHTVVYNHEMVLMRPLQAAAPVGTGALTFPVSTLAVYDLAPLDSYDFTGLGLPVAAGGLATAWHYARASDATSTVATHGWHFVYPGRYNAAESLNMSGPFSGPRQQGTQEAGGDQDSGGPNPVAQLGWNPTTSGNKDPWELNKPNPDLSIGTYSSVLPTGTKGTYDNTFPIQLPSQDQLLINAPKNTGTPEVFPHGKFARNGDAMDIPFIGSYRIAVQNGSQFDYVEFNSVSMDAAMAEDTVTNDDPGFNPTSKTYAVGTDNGTQYREQIGRFCPLPNTDGTALPNDQFVIGAPQIIYGDFPGYSLADDVRSNSANAQHAQWITEMQKMSYHWAADLLDYVGTNSGAPLDPVNRQTDPVAGLININTASWEVLAMIPWFPSGTGTGNQYNATKDLYRLIPDPADPNPGNPDPRNYIFDSTPNTPNQIADNIELARAIVTWRDGIVTTNPANQAAPGLAGHGPFKSIYDLYKIPAFRAAQAAVVAKLNAASQEPGDNEGDISPLDLSASVYDNVRYDSEEQYLMLHRVSNLITTRSDTFTVYLVVQGWRLDPSAPNNPQLVTQRRAAMIVDRSKYTPTNPSPTIYNVPTQK